MINHKNIDLIKNKTMLSKFKGRFKGIMSYDAEKDKYYYTVYERQLTGIVVWGSALSISIVSWCYGIFHGVSTEETAVILSFVMSVSTILAMILPISAWQYLKLFKELKTFESEDKAIEFISKKYLEVTTKERFF